MNKRERFLNAVAGHEVDRVPVTVWLHFVSDFMDGDESARLHARFLRQYPFDLAKVVSDYRFPLPDGLDAISSPQDMLRIKAAPMSHRSYREQLHLIKILRADLGDDWPIVDTTFDPVQQLTRRLGYSTTRMIFDNPRESKPMLEAATETVIHYLRELKKLGVEGVLYSIRGAATEACEQGVDDATFREFMRPYDIAILEAMEGMVRILHACKTHLDLSRVDDYPYEVLNWWDRHKTCPSLAELRQSSDKCLMGGIDQASVIERNIPEIRAEIRDAIDQVGSRKFILSPGCTIASNVPAHVLRAIASWYPEALTAP